MRRVWKNYFNDFYNEEVVVHMCGFDGVWRGNYFGREPIRKTEVEERVTKLKNGRAASKDEVAGEMVKSGGGLDLEAV